MPYPETWAGIECTRVRVGRRVRNQLDLTGHSSRLTDLDLVASLGVSAVRYPVLWETIAARGLARADWTWADERLARMRQLGIRPIAGLLHHGSGPAGMSLSHPDFPRAFARYAGAVARRYPWIDTFLPINEPLTTARFSALYGWWHPGRSSLDECVRLLLNECLAIRACGEAIKAVSPQATIIVNEDVGHTFSTPALATTADHLNERRWLTWDLLLGRVVRGHPMHEVATAAPVNRALLAAVNERPFVPDVLGVDHYVTSDRFLDERIHAYPAAYSRDGKAAYADVEACRVEGSPPDSVARAIDETWERFGLPLALTEISLAGKPLDQVAWWNEAWRAAVSARKRGIPVSAVTAWAVLGAVDWHCMMRRADGIYEPGVFDVSGIIPAERPVAAAIRRSARLSSAGRAMAAFEASRAATTPSSTVRRPRPQGWWTRRDRFFPAA